MNDRYLGWFGIARLGLVQMALGAIVVLTTSTMNRVMVVELALPAALPGALVGLHYALQVLRPRMGYGSDMGGRRTPWIVGGMAVLAAGGVLASLATAWMAVEPVGGMLLAVAAFTLIGIGVGSCGTTLLVLLAKLVDPKRRAAAASAVWLMMIGGFVVTATSAGHFLDPYTPARLVTVTTTVAVCAFVLTLLAVHGVERRMVPVARTSPQPAAKEETSFRQALAEVWAEPQARRFAIFVFVSMLAYSGQDLILEPFAGAVFGLTPGESTKLAGVQHAGVFLGMLLVAIAGSSGRARPKAISLRVWIIGGCVASAMALLGLAVGGTLAPAWPLKSSVFVLGVANGAFAVAAIGSMMSLVAAGRNRREGVRMGLWGAAQAVAFGIGGLAGASALDLSRGLLDDPAGAYGMVFAGEAALFLVSALLAARVGQTVETSARPAASSASTSAAGGEPCPVQAAGQ